MPTLYDNIIDEAENLALTRSLKPHASREEISKAVGLQIGERFSPDSSYGMLAEAAYNRYALLQHAINGR